MDIAEFTTEYQKNLSEIEGMIRLLGMDCEAFLKMQDTQTNRRAYVRSVFAMIEGAVYRMKLTSAQLGTVVGTLSPAELFAINEVTLDIDSKGEVTTKQMYPRFLNNVKFAFHVYSKSAESSFRLSLEGAGWQALVASTKVRDRLMHPKECKDLEVQNDEMLNCMNAFDWFLHSYTLCSMYSLKASNIKTNCSQKEIDAVDERITALEVEFRNRKL